MATCKDCIHHDICDAKGNLILTINDICELEYRTDVSKWWCKHFKPSVDVVPKSEVDLLHHLLKDAWERIEELNELCGKLQRKYDLAVAEREANVKGFTEELEKANAEIERLKYNLKAVLDEIPETKRELASEIFAEIQKSIVHNILHNESYSFEGVIDCITKDLDELKKKYTEETK